MAAREKERRLRQIHQRQEDRPAPPLPPVWHNAHPPNIDSQNIGHLWVVLIQQPIPISPRTDMPFPTSICWTDS